MLTENHASTANPELGLCNSLDLCHGVAPVDMLIIQSEQIMDGITWPLPLF